MAACHYLLYWNTGLNYWTKLFSVFGQVSIALYPKESYWMNLTENNWCHL